MKQLLRWKKEYGIVILIGVLALLLCANAAFSYRDLSRLVPMTRTCNQLPYQIGYPEEGAYPGAILPLMVSGKTIYTKDDIINFEFDMSDPVAPWENVLYKMYYGLNSRNLLKAMDANVVQDQSLNHVVISDETRKKCIDLGISNDLYRYSCAVNDISEEYGNYFHYYFFYSEHVPIMHVFLGTNDLEDFTPKGQEPFVAIWQQKEEGAGEDLYILSYDFYKTEVRP